MEENNPVIETPVKTPKKKFKLPSNKWMLVSIVLVVLLISSVAFQFGSGVTGMVVSEDEASSKAMTYIKSNFGVDPQLVGVTEKNNLYAVDMRIEGQSYLMYMSKDGELLFPQVFVLAGESEQVQQVQTQEREQPQQASIPKADKPKVELFVMSHCPYGNQMEKGIIPVVEALGDKIDFDLDFVYYAMHGEVEVYEQTTQYCIQKEQEDKLLPYLNCFLQAGDGGTCLVETGIDVSQLNNCVADTKKEFNIDENLADEGSWLSGRFPLFDINKGLNEKYGVGGSPTLIINGAQANVGRDSASLLNAICSSFNDAPAECDAQLSSAPPSPGFGGGTGSNNAAECS